MLFPRTLVPKLFFHNFEIKKTNWGLKYIWHKHCIKEIYSSNETNLHVQMTNSLTEDFFDTVFPLSKDGINEPKFLYCLANQFQNFHLKVSIDKKMDDKQYNKFVNFEAAIKFCLLGIFLIFSPHFFRWNALNYESSLQQSVWESNFFEKENFFDF